MSGLFSDYGSDSQYNESYEKISVPNLCNYWSGDLELFTQECAREVYGLIEQISGDKTLCKILSFVLENKVTFPNEISSVTGIDYSTVTRNVALLLENKILTRVKVDPQVPDILLSRRMEDFWSIGIKGFEEFHRRHLVTLDTEDRGGFFTVNWFRKLFWRISLQLGKRLIKGENPFIENNEVH